MVDDLKTAKPGQWYSKIKRMSNMQKREGNEFELDEFSGLSREEEANAFLNFYATTRGSFEPIDPKRFSHLLHDANTNKNHPNYDTSPFIHQQY